MASTPHRAYGVSEEGQGIDLTTGGPLVAPVLTPEEQWDEQWNLPAYLTNPTTDLSKLKGTQLEDYIRAHDTYGSDIPTLLYAYNKWKAGPTGTQAPADIGGPKAAKTDTAAAAADQQVTAADNQVPNPLPADQTGATQGGTALGDAVGATKIDTTAAGGSPQPQSNTTMAANPFTLPEDPTKNLPTATDLGQQQGDYYTSFLKNYAGLPQIESELSGQISQGTTAQLAQAAAERGVAGGSPGSPNMNAAYMRAMGLTSEALQQQGLQNLNAAYKTASPLDPLGTEKLSLESYVANLNQYGATARTIMQDDTQISLQKLNAASNMDLEKQRELGAQALAKINNDATMTREDKQLAAQLVIAKGGWQNSKDLANIAGGYGLLEAQIRAAGSGSGRQQTGTGGSSDTGTSGSGSADTDAAMAAYQRQLQYGLSGNTSMMSAAQAGQAGQTGTGTAGTFTGGVSGLTAAQESSLGLNTSAIEALGTYDLATQNDFLNTVSKMDPDSQALVNGLLNANYTPEEISLGFTGQGPAASIIMGGSDKTGYGTTTGTGGSITIGSTGLPKDFDPELYDYYGMSDTEWKRLSPTVQQALNSYYAGDGTDTGTSGGTVAGGNQYQTSVNSYVKLGWTPQQIADELNISVGEVNSMLGSVASGGQEGDWWQLSNGVWTNGVSFEDDNGNPLSGDSGTPGNPQVPGGGQDEWETFAGSGVFTNGFGVYWDADGNEL